jgi:glutamine synthetase
MSISTAPLAQQLERRGSEFERLRAEFSQHGVQVMHVQFPTFPGSLRSKLTPLDSALSSHEHGFNAAIFGLTHGDGNPRGDVVFESAASGSHNGWPDILSLADPDSAVIIPWRPATGAVILNTFEMDGSVSALDVRARIAALERRAADLGYETRFAMEYEAFLFHADDDALAEGRYKDLKPFGRDLAYCDHLRHPRFEEFAREYMLRLKSIGIGVASWHTEYGRGMVEFALEPKAALAAADAAARARLYLVELCEENGLVATFMARCTAMGTESTSGAHLHQSLSHDGANAFASDDSSGAPALSEVAIHYVGGLLDTVRDFQVIFRPTVNSYRRMNRDEWSPVDVSWGFERRTAAIRAVTQPFPTGVRLEHRVSGADTNPYMVILVALGGGLRGIEQRIEPRPPETEPDADAERLADNLLASIETLRESEAAREILGQGLVDHYAASRLNEWAAWQEWLAGSVTEFEYRRYFEAH